MLAFANTKALRAQWIRALEKVEALDPWYVVPGHKRADEIDGVWHIAATKKYIRDFGRLVEGQGLSGYQEVYDGMTGLYGERFNNLALRMSVQGTLRAMEKEKQQAKI